MKLQYYHKVWAVLVFGWISNYMVRAGLSPVLIPLQKEFGFSYSEAGLIASALFYAYVGMLFPAGYIGDRIGHKFVLVVCTFWWSICSFLTGLTNSFSSLFIARFLTGIGQGSYFSNDRPIIAAYTPKEKLGIGQGVSFIGLGTGMFLGYILSGLISLHFGWRAVFIIFSIPSLAAAILIVVLIREPTAKSTSIGAIKRKHVPLSMAFKSSDLWRLYIGGIPAIYALWMAGTWTPSMFDDLGAESLAISSTLGSMFGIAAIPGLIITGLISDKMMKSSMGRKGLIGIEFLLIGLFLFLMGWAVRQRWSPYTAALITFGIGFFAWGHWAAFYALVADIVPKEIRGTCYGLTNSTNFIGSLVAPPLTGWVKDLTASFEWGCYLGTVFILIGSVFVFSIQPSFRFKPETPILLPPSLKKN